MFVAPKWELLNTNHFDLWTPTEKQSFLITRVSLCVKNVIKDINPKIENARTSASAHPKLAGHHRKTKIIAPFSPLRSPPCLTAQAPSQL